MNLCKRLTAALFTLMLAAAFCGCGQNTESDTDSAQNSTVSSENPDTAALPEPEIGSEMTIGVASTTAKAGQKAVPVNIQVWNNAGIAACGIKLGYDPALKAISNGNVSPFSGAPEAEIETGDAAARFMTSCLIGEDEHLIAFGAMSSEPSTVDGVIFTCYFDVPADAVSGTDYQFTCEIDSINDANSQPLACETVTGILRIE